MKLQILMSGGCSHGLRTLDLVKEVLAARGVSAEVETIMVSTTDDAARLGFPGSPTLRVNGVDIEPNPPTSVALG